MRRQERERENRLTHHRPSVERVGSDGDHDVLSDSLEDLSTGNKEAVVLEALLDLVLGPVSSLSGGAFSETFLVRDLLDSVRFSSGSRLVALDGVTSKEDSVDLMKKKK